MMFKQLLIASSPFVSAMILVMVGFYFGARPFGDLPDSEIEDSRSSWPPPTTYDSRSIHVQF